MKLLRALALLVFIVPIALGLAIYSSLQSAGAVPSVPPVPSFFSFSDMLALWFSLFGVMVALASLVVTGVGILVAILAIVGYRTFKDEVAKSAQTAALIFAEDYFKGKAFGDKLKENVGMGSWQSGTVTGTAGPVAKKYPRKTKKEGDAS
jgi:hypothetical protein